MTVKRRGNVSPLEILGPGLENHLNPSSSPFQQPSPHVMGHMGPNASSLCPIPFCVLPFISFFFTSSQPSQILASWVTFLSVASGMILLTTSLRLISASRSVQNLDTSETMGSHSSPQTRPGSNFPVHPAPRGLEHKGRKQRDTVFP